MTNEEDFKTRLKIAKLKVQKKILSEKPYLEYQKIFPDQLDRNRYEEINSNYIKKKKIVKIRS